MMYSPGVHVTGASRDALYTSTVLARLDESRAASYTFDLEWVPTPPIIVPPTAQVIKTGSISAIAEPGTSAVLDALARSRGHALMCFNPNAHPSITSEPAATLASFERFIALADVVKASDENIERLTGGVPIDEVVDHWLGMGVPLVAVTHGEHGSLVITSSGVRSTKTPSDVKAVDMVGAGDSFMDGTIDAMQGIGLRDADARATPRALPEEQVHVIIDCASAVSDVIVSHKGADPPQAHEFS